MLCGTDEARPARMHGLLLVCPAGGRSGPVEAVAGAAPVVAAVAEIEPLRDSWAMRVYPYKYLRCPVCQVPAGARCVSRSGMVVDGRPDGAVTVLDRPHTSRRISKARSAR